MDRVNRIPLLALIEKGWFEKEGLLVENAKPMYPKEVVSALLGGEIDYAYYNGTEALEFIEASLRNAPIKTIMLPERGLTFFLVAQPEIETLGDLNTIAISYGYAPKLFYYPTRKFIEEHNLEVELIIPEATIENYPFLEIQNWLLKGEVDAVFIDSAAAYSLQAQGFQILGSAFYILPAGLSVREDRIEKNPEEVQKAVSALEKTMDFIVSKSEETKKLILKAWNLEETEENINLVNNYYPFLKDTINRRDVPYDEGAELLIQIAKAGEFETLEEVEKQVVTQEELDKVFDFRFVR